MTQEGGRRRRLTLEVSTPEGIGYGHVLAEVLVLPSQRLGCLRVPARLPEAERSSRPEAKAEGNLTGDPPTFFTYVCKPNIT